MPLSCPYCDRWEKFEGDNRFFGAGGLVLGLGLGYLLSKHHYHHKYPKYYYYPSPYYPINYY